MLNNELRSSKKSKDAQAERIIQSLSQKTRPYISYNSKKIKKKKKIILDESFQLIYKSKNGNKKFVNWIMPKSYLKMKENSFKTQEKMRIKEIKYEKSYANSNEEVNYAAIFESAYEDLKSESSQSKNIVLGQLTRNKINDDARVNDSYSSIEYDPIDNYFYLVSNDNSSKKQLFKNKAISIVKQSPCIILNPTIIENLKKSFELDSFLC